MKNKLKKILTLLKGIYQYNFLSYFKPLAPTELQINVTYKCNSRCQMCHIWKMQPQNELRFSEWQKILKDPIFKSIKRLMIAGGEPILHPNLIKLTRRYLDSMPELQFLSLTTNGFLEKKTIDSVKTLAKLTQEKNVSFSVAVSLDGLAKVHQEIRRVPRAFEKTSRTILGLKRIQSKYGFGLGVACVVCNKNLAHVKKLEKWCAQYNIPLSFQLVGFHQTYVNNLHKKQSLDFGKKERSKLFAFLKELINKKDVSRPRSFLRSYFWHDMLNLYQGKVRKSPCAFLKDAFVLGSLGDVYYCLSQKAIGNCRQDHNVSQIYYHPKNLAFRNKLAKTSCLKCNSACFITSAIAKDFKKFFCFLLTGK